MYWKYNSPSAEIDALLQKEDVSLSELMSKDELLQECKIPNKKVIEFLTKCEVLEELVLMIVSDPSDTVDIGLRYKNANLAAELLTCDSLIEKLVIDANLVQHLYKFYHNEKPLNPILASFVSKVFATPLQRKSEQNWYSYQYNCFQVLEFAKATGDFVDLLVNHVGTSAIMDFLSLMISGVEEDDQDIRDWIHKWLDSCCLVDKLVDKMSPESEPEEHSSIESILCEISYCGARETNSNSNGNSHHSATNLLVITLQSERIINKMLDLLLKENWSPSSVRHVINVIITLFSSHSKMVQNFDHYTLTASIPTETPFIPAKDNTMVVAIVIERLFELQNMLLRRPSWPETIPTAFGSQIERLGSTKLQVVTFISALICTNYDKVHEKMAALSTLQLLLDMFYKFSLNNFLHTQVTHAITCILVNPVRKMVVDDITTPASTMMEAQSAEPFQVPTLQDMCKNVSHLVETEKEAETVPEVEQHPLLEQLFTKCQIVQRLLVDLYPQEVKDTEKKNHNTKGYMGHLRIIANCISSCSKNGKNSHLINKYIEALPNGLNSEWEDFALITLAELNLKNEIIPVKDFKASDMETNSFRDADSFRTVGEGMSDDNVDFDDATSNWTNAALFEKMCSDKNVEFDDMWKFEEKEIKFPEMIVKDSDEEEAHDSSSDEEDDRFSNLKSCDNKIDTDDEGWSEVFDKRNETGGIAASANNNTDFNPWHSATASDTSDNSWANFENAQQQSGQSLAQLEADCDGGKKSSLFFSLVKEESSNADAMSEEGEGAGGREHVPPVVFEVDFHSPFYSCVALAAAAPKSPFVADTSQPDVSVEEVCDSKLSTDDCMQNRQDSSNSTSNI